MTICRPYVIFRGFLNAWQHWCVCALLHRVGEQVINHCMLCPGKTEAKTQAANLADPDGRRSHENGHRPASLAACSKAEHVLANNV